MSETTSRRRLISSGAPWEPVVGYSRAVRAGDTVYVSGTAAVGAEGASTRPATPMARPGVPSPSLSARSARRAPRSPTSSVPAYYVRDIADWQAAGRAHGEVFGLRPATTLVAVRDFIEPEMLVEIEAEAVVLDAAG